MTCSEKILRTALICAWSLIGTCCIELQQCHGSQWNNNTRDHLFGAVDNPTVGDEGFRWRDSLNFQMERGKAVRWTFSRPILDNNELANNQMDGIHQYMQERVQQIFKETQEAANLNGGVEPCNVAVAAVTVVVENGDHQYEAYSKLISAADDRVLACINGSNHIAPSPSGQYCPSLLSDKDIKEVLSKFDFNLPENVYSCAEGKLIASLVTKDYGLLLNNLQNAYPNIVQNIRNVRMIVLHIGTLLDPCAICTRVLVGLSNYLNRCIDQLKYNENDGFEDTKFLVEVSSSEPYYPSRLIADNYTSHYRGNGYEDKTSHLECTGHDGNEKSPIVIGQKPTGDWDSERLAIPYGIGKSGKNKSNWILKRSFPPYIIFSRITKKGTKFPTICKWHQQNRTQPLVSVGGGE